MNLYLSIALFRTQRCLYTVVIRLRYFSVLFNLGLINAFAFGWNKETLRRLNRDNFKVKPTIEAPLSDQFCFF